MKPIALITEANKGIGLEVARQLGLKGWQVLMSVRNLNRGQIALNKLKQQKIRAELIQLDMSKPDQIQEAVIKIQQRFGRIDVLINNAALLMGEGISLSNTPDSELEMTYQVNVMGPFRLICECVPLMSKGARIINVSSGAGVLCGEIGGYAPLYSMSKTALNAVTRHWANHLRSKGIAVNSVCPGWVRTDMGGRGAPRSVVKGAETIVWLAKEAPIELTDSFLRDKEKIGW